MAVTRGVLILYLWYFQVQRQMRGKPVTVVAKTAGRRWRAMSITQRLEYYDHCGQGSNWGASLPIAASRCSSGLSGRAPAVSRSPFINFFVQMYREVSLKSYTVFQKIAMQLQTSSRTYIFFRLGGTCLSQW